jgi:hypothetical protein
MTPSQKLPRPLRKPSKGPFPVCFSAKSLEILNALVEHLVVVRAEVDVLLLKLRGTLDEQGECRRRESSLSVTEKEQIAVSKLNYCPPPYSDEWYRKTYLEIINNGTPYFGPASKLPFPKNAGNVLDRRCSKKQKSPSLRSK